MKVLIAGGTGLIGSELARTFLKRDYSVYVLTRKTDIPSRIEGVTYLKWDGKTIGDWVEHLEGADAVVNLSGSNIAGEKFFPSRWTPFRLKEIRDSRIDSGRALLEGIRHALVKPSVLVQSSAIGFYGNQPGEMLLDESSPPANDTMALLCQDWESCTSEVEGLGVRRVVIRTGVVLTLRGGALPRLALPFRLFVGGPMGSGKQVISWIHILDMVEAIRFLVEKQDAQGVYNLTAPTPVTNAEFGKTLAKILRRPYFFPVPGFAMRLLFGDVASVVLDGQRVRPQRLLSAGYVFRFSRLQDALQDLLSPSEAGD